MNWPKGVAGRCLASGPKGVTLFSVDGVVDDAPRPALLAAIPDLVFRLAADGTYLDVVGDISSLATPAEELVGSRVDELLPADAAGPLLAAVGDALSAGAARTVEYELRTLASGEQRRFEARVVPLGADDVAAFVRDVTDQRRFAREQESLRRLATLVAAGADEVEIVQAIAAELGGLFDADFANALRWDGATLEVVGTWDRDGRRRGGARVYTYGGDTISVRVVEAGAPARVDSSDDFRTAFARDRWRELGLGASIGAPVHVRGRTWGVVTASRNAGRPPFPIGAENHLADFATLLAQAIENADARRQMARLLDEQSALRRLATLVAAGRPPSEVLAELTQDVGRLLDAHAVTIVRWEGVLDEVVVVRAWTAGARAPRPPGTVLHGRPGDAMIDALETGVASSSVGRVAQVAAPLITNAVLRGALVAERAADDPFPADAATRLRAFADVAAQSIGNDRAQRALRDSRARIVREGDEARRRLERNLHDGAQQRLVAVSTSLRFAISLLDQDFDRARDLLAAAAEELSNAMEELRDLARGLHPAILSDRGLEPALRALVVRSALPVTLQCEVTGRLPAPVEAAAYYVAAEALTNAAKYAQARAVTLSARIAEGAVVLQVVDDGAGGASIAAGSGLQGLVDRVEAIGGRLDLHSPSGIGTTVRAIIPLAD